jgi:hypothetical protein
LKLNFHQENIVGFGDVAQGSPLPGVQDGGLFHQDIFPRLKGRPRITKWKG